MQLALIEHVLSKIYIHLWHLQQRWVLKLRKKGYGNQLSIIIETLVLDILRHLGLDPFHMSYRWNVQ